MFAPPKPLVPSNGPGIMGPGFSWHGSGPRISESYHGVGLIFDLLSVVYPTTTIMFKLL